MKYIVFENHSGNCYPILFPDLINHCDIAKKFPDDKPISAGSCKMVKKGFIVFGESITLGVGSKFPKDGELIDRAFNKEIDWGKF